MATWALVVVTCLLVGVTAFYAWQTRQLVRKMAQQNQPFIIVRLEHNILKVGHDQEYVSVCIENTGKDHAYEIECEPVPDIELPIPIGRKLSDLPEMKLPCLPAGDKRVFHLGPETEVLMSIRGEEFSIKCSYKDKYGTVYPQGIPQDTFTFKSDDVIGFRL